MMVDENRPQSGWGSKVIKGFQKSWAWLAAVFGFVLAAGPDLANFALTNMGVISTVFPEMSLRQKAIVLFISNVLVIVLRPLKQPKWMRPEEGATVPVAIIRVPETVAVGPDAVVIATEVVSTTSAPAPSPRRWVDHAG